MISLRFSSPTHRSMGIISQWPPLSGPTRRRMPASRNLWIARVTFLRSMPILSAISCVDIYAFSSTSSMIFGGVFWVVFWAVFWVVLYCPFIFTFSSLHVIHHTSRAASQFFVVKSNLFDYSGEKTCVFQIFFVILHPKRYKNGELL